MKLEKILNKYQNDHWVEEEAAISNFVIDAWGTCYLKWIDLFKDLKLYSTCFFLSENNNLFEWTSLEEGRRVLKNLLKSYKDNKKYWQQKDKDHNKINEEIDSLFYYFRDNDITKLSKQRLARYLKELVDIGLVSFGYNMTSEAMDVVDEEYYKKLLSNVPANKLLDIVNLFSTPDRVGFLEREHTDMLRIAKKYFKKQNLKKEIDKDLLVHQNNYFWIQNNYREAKMVKLEYFRGSLEGIFKRMSLKGINREINYSINKSEQLKKERQKIYKKYKISKQAKDFFSLLRLLAIWQDRRKENVQKILSAVEKILDVIYKQSRVSKETLREYFVQELIDLLIKNKKVSSATLGKRKKNIFYAYIENNKIKTKLFYGKDVIKGKKYFQRHSALILSEEIKGFVASYGKNNKILEGKVRIVVDANRDKFNKGEILVTGMTRPEFVPLMKKAKAIVTNEGGITTHAAIVSRELGIPCIIGTKIATKVFKNGDTIQLDLKIGTIKKL